MALKHWRVLDWIKQKLKDKFNIKDLEKMKTIIGWQVTWDWELSILRINQLAFICDFVKEEDIRNCNPISIPMKAKNFIKIQDKKDYKKANIKVYQCRIGKLIYLSCWIRLDISFVMGQLGKRNVDLRLEHLKAAK